MPDHDATVDRFLAFEGVAERQTREVPLLRTERVDLCRVGVERTLRAVRFAVIEPYGTVPESLMLIPKGPAQATEVGERAFAAEAAEDSRAVSGVDDLGWPDGERRAMADLCQDARKCSGAGGHWKQRREHSGYRDQPAHSHRVYAPLAALVSALSGVFGTRYALAARIRRGVSSRLQATWV